MNSGYIDKGFQPHLFRYDLPPKAKEWLEIWGINPVGVPVYVPRKLKAAVWPGSTTITGEAPVLAVLTEPHLAARADHNIWYIGVLALQAERHEQLEQEHYMEAAEFGPHNLLEALSLLAKFVPPQRR